MTPTPPPKETSSGKGKRFALIGCGGCLGVVLLIVLTVVITMHMVGKSGPHDELQLSAEEQAALDAKLGLVEAEELPEGTIRFSEKELNAWLIQQDPALEETLRIELDRNRITAAVRMPHPLHGDEMLEVRGSIEVLHTPDSFSIKLKKVKFGLFPVPSAWLDQLFGDITDENLAEHFLASDVAFQRFMEGVEKIEITDDEFIFVPAQE